MASFSTKHGFSMKMERFRLKFSTNISKNLNSNSKNLTNWSSLMQLKTTFWSNKSHLTTRSLLIGSLKLFTILKTVNSGSIVSLLIQESTQISTIFHKITSSLKFLNLMSVENGLPLLIKAKNILTSTKSMFMISLTLWSLSLGLNFADKKSLVETPESFMIKARINLKLILKFAKIQTVQLNMKASQFVNWPTFLYMTRNALKLLTWPDGLSNMFQKAIIRKALPHSFTEVTEILKSKVLRIWRAQR